jgi:hypothetical protein
LGILVVSYLRMVRSNNPLSAVIRMKGSDDTPATASLRSSLPPADGGSQSARRRRCGAQVEPVLHPPPKHPPGPDDHQPQPRASTDSHVLRLTRSTADWPRRDAGRRRADGRQSAETPVDVPPKVASRVYAVQVRSPYTCVEGGG